jgi:hypothetical protein
MFGFVQLCMSYMCYTTRTNHIAMRFLLFTEQPLLPLVESHFSSCWLVALPGDMHAHRWSEGPCVNCNMQNIAGLTWPDLSSKLPPLTYIVHTPFLSEYVPDIQKQINSCHGSRTEGKFAASTARVPVRHGCDGMVAPRSPPRPLRLYIYEREEDENAVAPIASEF